MIMAEVEFSIMRALNGVLAQIREAAARRSKDLPQITPRLVCVSKTQPASKVIEAYEAGQRHFGENYANELHEKGNDKDLLEKCKEIRWHYIGHLQTNKINKVLGTPRLYIIETIHSKKLAENVNKQWPKYSPDGNNLNVMVQVNTSGEDAKNGIEPTEVIDLVKYIRDNCPNLNLTGLMTIGQYGYDCSLGPNPDFLCLAKCRQEVCSKFDLKLEEVELSMGMSCDFEQAIELGATNVRVGTSILGNRNPR